MPSVTYRLRAKLWRYDGHAAWMFLTLPKAQGREIKQAFAGMTRGFRSLRVTVTVGKTTWKTSIFPDAKSGSYLLPMKAAVRKAEGLDEGKMVAFQIEVEV